MGQEQYSSVEDFVSDKSFRDWVLKKEVSPSPYWEYYLHQYPGKENAFNYAQAIILSLQTHYTRLSEEEINTEIEKILDRAHAEQEYPAVKVVRLRRVQWWKIAAAVLVMMASSWWVWNTLHTPGAGNRYATYEIFSGNSKNEAVEYINNGDSTQKILLNDGSIVRLERKSKLTYAHTAGSKREVYLQGEAFFEVTKDPSKPFIVYTDDIVTKVLGTSFRIKSQSGKKSSVMVVSGKVSVYKKANFDVAASQPNSLTGMVVIPNQQVIYTVASQLLQKEIVTRPVMIDTAGKAALVFNSTPVKEVFDRFQKLYGITIIYDEKVISSCSLTATMGEETFYEKLNLVCKAIRGSYEIIDGSVVISSYGCH